VYVVLFEKGAEGVIVRMLLLVANVNAMLGEKLIFVVVAVIFLLKTTVTAEVVATPSAPFTGVWLTTSEAACVMGANPTEARRKTNARKCRVCFIFVVLFYNKWQVLISFIFTTK